MQHEFITKFIEDAEERGTVVQSELEALVLEHDLEEVELAELVHELDVRGIERIEPEDETATETEATAKTRELDLTAAPSGTTDSLQLFLNEIGRHALLTAAEEVALAKRVERGDLVAKERMINSNLRLVVSVAKRYQGHGVPLLDLVQDGVDRPEPRGREVRLAAAATSSRRTPRGGSARPSSVRSRTRRGRSACPCTCTSAGRSSAGLPSGSSSSLAARQTVDELAKATDLRLDHAEEALAVADASVSLNQAVGSDADGELGDLFADETAVDPEEEASQSLRRQAVRDIVKQLPERERRVVELRFGLADGETWALEAIGRELGLTRERVRQLESSALAKLQRGLSGDDFELAA